MTETREPYLVWAGTTAFRKNGTPVLGTMGSRAYHADDLLRAKATILAELRRNGVVLSTELPTSVEEKR